MADSELITTERSGVVAEDRLYHRDKLTAKQAEILRLWLDPESEMTQRDIARAVGVCDSYVSQILSGHGAHIERVSRERMLAHVKALDTATLKHAQAGDPAMMRLAYQRLGILVEKSEFTQKDERAEHELRQVAREGGLEALAARAPGLVAFLRERAVRVAVPMRKISEGDGGAEGAVPQVVEGEVEEELPEGEG